MWTQTLGTPSLDNNGNVSLSITLTKDGVDVYRNRVVTVSSLDQLRVQIKNLQDQAEKGLTLVDEIKSNPDLSVKPVSQDELDKNAFYDKYNKLKSLRTASKEFTVDAKTLTDLEAEVKSLYKSEYVIF